jgi:uncharacterized phage infection (PIP) family protein YhgE
VSRIGPVVENDSTSTGPSLAGQRPAGQDITAPASEHTPAQSVVRGQGRRELKKTATPLEGFVSDLSTGVPLLDAAVHTAAATAQVTARRVLALMRLIDRAGSALDDIAELRQSAQYIAGNLADLTKSAAGIDRNSAEIAREITGLTTAAQGIDTHAEDLTAEITTISQIIPTLQQLADIVGPLDNTVARLGRFVDRLPGGRRAVASRRKDPPHDPH